MRTRLKNAIGLFFLCCSIATFVNLSVFAEEKESDEDRVKSAEEGVIYHFGNRFCPLAGEPVSPDAYAEYRDDKKGVYGRIYMCCAGCQNKIEKDLPRLYKAFYRTHPRKGVEIAPLDLKNEECPVSGKPVSGEAKIEYNGMIVHLCCTDCTEKFVKDPDPGLTKIVPDLEDYVYEPPAGSGSAKG